MLVLLNIDVCFNEIGIFDSQYIVNSEEIAGCVKLQCATN